MAELLDPPNPYWDVDDEEAGGEEKRLLLLLGC